MAQTSHPLAIFGLCGDEAQLGRQHGTLTREVGDWEATHDFYASLPAHILGGGRRDRGRALMVRALGPLIETGLGRLDRARPAHLRERTEAFLAALGQPAAERRHVLALDATQNTIGLLARLGLVREAGRLAMPGACSSFAIWGEASEDGRLLHARNFDLPGIGIWDRRPTVVFCAPRHDGLGRGLRYGFLATRGADVPGVTAFNEAGIVISAHTRFHREVSFDGLGVVDLGHALAARATSLADAVAIASERRIASSWGIVVSSARERRALVIEAHAGRIAVHRPRPGASHLAVANRNRVPVMQAGEVTPSMAWLRYSDGREAVLERRLDGALGLGVADAMALLSSHEAGDVPGWERSTGDCLAQSISVQSAIVDAEREQVWVSAGASPTSKGPWVRVPWRWGGGPEVRVEVAAGGTGASGGGDADPLALRREAAYHAFMEAARLEGLRGSEADVEQAMARAIAIAPDDPSYRHIAGGLALRSGRPDEALVHLESALAHERSTFRRGELLRWASVAARWAGRPRRAVEHAAALAAERDPACRQAQTAARRAPSSRRHREIGVDLQLLTIHL